MLVIIIAWIFADVLGIVVGLEAMKYHGFFIGGLLVSASLSRLLAIFYMYRKESSVPCRTANVVSISD